MTTAVSRPLAIEIAVQDTAGVAIARELRADRVELAQALSLGGLTPSLGAIERAVDEADESQHIVEVHVLIRPRAGNFDYNRDEIATCVADIRAAIERGASGVVVGCLGEDGRLDRPAMRQFVDAAGDKPVTLHRAIDVSRDPVATLESAIELGVARVLTSGGASSVGDGLAPLQRLVSVAAGRIEVMAGGGVSAENVAAVAATGVDAVHFSAKRTITSRTQGAAGGSDAPVVQGAAGDAASGSAPVVRLGSADSGLGGFETTDRAAASAILSALPPR